MHDAKKAQTIEKDMTWTVNDELMSAEEWAEKDRLDREAHQQYWENKGREEAYKEAYKEGYKIGFQEGREEERTSLIEYMLNKGRNIEDISSITGYPIDEVKSVSSNKIL